MFLGAGQLSTSFTFSFCISTPFGPITTPRNSTSLTFYLYFSSFTNRSFSSNLLNTFSTSLSCPSLVSIATKILSIKIVVLLSLSLDDSRTTLGECLGRTRWSSPLDWTTYLYYFYKWLYTTSPWSHVLLECSTITWQGHVIRLLKFPCYLYLVFIVWLDICN